MGDDKVKTTWKVEALLSNGKWYSSVFRFADFKTAAIYAHAFMHWAVAPKWRVVSTRDPVNEP